MSPDSLQNLSSKSAPSTSMMAAVKDVAIRFFNGFNEHDDMTLAASLAFYTALSLAPLILLVVSAVGLLGGDSQARLVEQMTSLVGHQAGDGLKLIVQSADKHTNSSGLAGSLGLLTLVFSASAVFAQLQSSMNVIWDAQSIATGAGWWVYIRRRFFSMGMVLALAFLAIVSLLVTTGLSFVLSRNGVWWEIINFGGSIIAFTFLFALIFKYVPDGKIAWRHVMLGGAITSILFTIGRSAIGFYLGTSAPGSAYGAAGSFIVLLAWVYYSAIILFVGAELTRAIFDNEKRTT